MYGRWAARIAGRPWAFLLGNLAVAAGAALVALSGIDRVAVAGGLSGGEPPGGEELVLVVADAEPVPPAIRRESFRVIRSALAADDRIAEVTAVQGGSGPPLLRLRLAGESAAERQRAAEEIPAQLDPGPLELVARGEAITQAAARKEVRAEVWRLALLVAPIMIVLVALTFGARHAAAPLLAAVTGALGGFASLVLAAQWLDLGAVGIAVALAVGAMVGFEAAFLLRRSFAAQAVEEPVAMLESCLAGTLPRLVAGCAGAGLASLALLAVALPAARAAAIGGAAAALLAAASALVAMSALLAIAPAAARRHARAGAPRSMTLRSRLSGERARRVRSAIAARRALAWIPLVATAAALGLVGAQALSPDLVALEPADVGGSAAPPLETPSAAIEAEASATAAEQALTSRFGAVIGGITLAALTAAYLAGRRGRAMLVAGLAGGLPAAAACGLLVLAATERLPRALFDIHDVPHAGALLAALAAVGATSALHAGLGDRRGALVGTSAVATIFGVLAFSAVEAVAQVGAGIAAGVAIDLVALRLLVAPAIPRMARSFAVGPTAGERSG